MKKLSIRIRLEEVITSDVFGFYYRYTILRQFKWMQVLLILIYYFVNTANVEQLYYFLIYKDLLHYGKWYDISPVPACKCDFRGVLENEKKGSKWCWLEDYPCKGLDGKIKYHWSMCENSDNSIKYVECNSFSGNVLTAKTVKHFSNQFASYDYDN